MSKIFASPLNRDVSVGCLYDYNNAAILPEFLTIKSENVEHSKLFRPTVQCVTITSDDSEKSKLFSFGIDHHLSRQLKDKKLEMNRLWFYNYLKNEAFSKCNNNEVQVSVYLVFTRRTESLNDDFISSNIWRYHDNEHSGTHLVQEVDYGAEFILWMRKPVDPSKETKDYVEKAMDFALGNYLENFFNGISSPPSTLDKMLETMICSFQGSIGNSFVSNVTFEQCLRMIKELTDMEMNDRQNIWRPVGMRLRRFPTKVEIQVATDLYEEIVFNFKENHQWLTNQCQHLIQSPSLQRVPSLKKSLVVVQDLLEPIASAFNKLTEDLQGKHYSRKQYQLITVPYTNLMTTATDWLTKYHQDVEKMTFLLEGNNLQVLDLRSIDKPVEEVAGDVKRTRVFVLHFECHTVDLDERFKKWAKNPANDLPVFESENLNQLNVPWEKIYKKWQGFLNKANHSEGNNIDYAVGILSPNSPYDEEGMVVTIGNEEILRAVNCPPSYENLLPNFPHWAYSSGGQKRLREDSDDASRSTDFPSGH